MNAEADPTDELPVPERQAQVLGSPPKIAMTSPLHRFFDEHHRTMSLFLYVSELAKRSDHVRVTAAKALLAGEKDGSERAASYKRSVDHPNAAFSHLRKYGDIQSRNLLLSLVNNFLCFLSEAAQSAILKQPSLLKSNSMIRVDEVMSFRRRTEMVSYLVDRQINELSYGGLLRLEEYMKDRLAIEVFESEQERSLMVVAIELRNIHTHNRGVINHLFLSRVKGKSQRQFSINNQYRMDFDEFSEIADCAIATAVRIDSLLSAKFGLRKRRFAAWKEDATRRP